MSDKLPALQFYVGDWKKDPGVQALDLETRMVWFEILLLMHESEERGKLLLNGRPMPEEALAKLLGVDAEKAANCVSKIISYGVASLCPITGALMNRRMSRDEHLRAIRAAAGSEGGKQKASKRLANTLAKATPSSSSSSSFSFSDETEVLRSTSSERQKIPVSPNGSSSQGSHRKQPEKEWPPDGLYVKKFLDQQTYLSEYYTAEDLRSLNDPVWWENLSTAVNGLSEEFLDREFALMANWLKDHPRRHPTPKGLRSFVGGWIKRTYEDERKKSWLSEKRVATIIRR